MTLMLYPIWKNRNSMGIIPIHTLPKTNVKRISSGIFFMCNILIPLLIGAYIYIFADRDSYFGNFVRSILNLSISETNSNVVIIMRNWGCDFLFAYALLFSLYMNTTNLCISISCTAICSVGLELLQLIQVDFLKCGTFDIIDIVIEIVAICFGATIISCFNYIKTKGGRM